MTHDDLARKWLGPPLALQITALLVAGLVIAQLATLVLTLLLPPQPPPRHQLGDIARALTEGDDRNHASDPRWTRVLQSIAPQPGGPGWLTSERSRRELAQLLDRDEAAVRLFFYTPLPFAGTASAPPRPLSGAISGSDSGRQARFATPPSRPPEGLMRTDYEVAQAGGGPGGGPGGGGLGGGSGGGWRGGFGGPQGFDGPGRNGPQGGQGSARDSGAGLDRGLDSSRRSAPNPAVDTSEGSRAPTRTPETVESRTDAGSPTAAAVPPSAGVPAMPPEANAPAGSPTPNSTARVPSAVEAAKPSTPTQPLANAVTSLPAPQPTTRLPEGPPGRSTASAPIRATQAPTGESRAPDRTGVATGAATPAIGASPTQESPTDARLPLSSSPASRSPRQAMPPSAASSSERAEVDLATPARGLFGLAPAPFVEGDFIAALQRPQGDWVVVQPVPETFPNAWQRRVLLWFAVALLLVAPAGWWFSRRLVRPIVGFARAAEQLGRDPRAPVPIPEGPAEVGRAARALAGMQGRLRNFVEDRTAMIGAISHDLRTPLTRMRFRIEDVPDEVRAGMLGDVEEMERMIASVLNFLRDASEPGTRERLDLLSIVEDVVEDARFVGKDVRLEHGESVAVEVDAIAVRRVLDNLVDNAVKYGEQARVRLFIEPFDAVAEVSDSGPGLPEEELVRVFQPFYRDRGAHRSGKPGSGLGLAVCRSIARAHGGDVALSSNSRGLVAQFRLPRLSNS